MRFVRRFVRDFDGISVPEANHRSWTFRGEVYYSLRETSRRLGRGVCTVQSHVRKGRMQATLVNGRPWMPSWVLASMLARKAGRKTVEYFVASREGDPHECVCFDDYELAVAVRRLAPVLVRRESVKARLFAENFRFYREILIGEWPEGDREPLVATVTDDFLSVETGDVSYSLPLPFPEGFPADLADIRRRFLSGENSSVIELLTSLFP